METKKNETATFAGGCFWCTASTFDGIDGIIDIISGYTGGEVAQPTYEQVTSGTTGHYEAVRIIFDPALISYQKLLTIFFQQIDPTDPDGSFVDRGSQYRSAVFYHTEIQKNEAETMIKKINGSRHFETPVATKILPETDFYEAELYHQDYHRKNPGRYKFYRAGSGRDIFIEKKWRHFRHIFETDNPS